MSTAESIKRDAELEAAEEEGPVCVHDIIQQLERKQEIADETLRHIDRHLEICRKLDEEADLTGLRKTIRECLQQLDKLWVD